jgi:hypothetical protein
VVVAVDAAEGKIDLSPALKPHAPSHWRMTHWKKRKR